MTVQNVCYVNIPCEFYLVRKKKRKESSNAKISKLYVLVKKESHSTRISTGKQCFVLFASWIVFLNKTYNWNSKSYSSYEIFKLVYVLRLYNHLTSSSIRNTLILCDFFFYMAANATSKKVKRTQYKMGKSTEILPLFAKSFFINFFLLNRLICDRK